MHLPFPLEGWPRNSQELLRYKANTYIAVRIYNALLRNRIEPKIEKLPKKNQMAFGEIDARRHKFWRCFEFLKVFKQKNLDATIVFVDFSKAFDSIHRWKIEQILLTYGLP